MCSHVCFHKQKIILSLIYSLRGKLKRVDLLLASDLSDALIFADNCTEHNTVIKSTCSHIPSRKIGLSQPPRLRT